MVIIPSSIGLVFEPDKMNFIRFNHCSISRLETENAFYIIYRKHNTGKSFFSDKLVICNGRFVYCFEERINIFRHMFRLEQDKIFRERWQSLFPRQIN